MSGENKSGSSMNYAYLEAFRKRKNEMLASEIDFFEEEDFSDSNMSGNSVFLESFRKRKKKLLAAELNIVETYPEISKEIKDGSSRSVPRNRESFGASANSNKKAAEPFPFTPKNPKSLSNGIDNERSMADKKPANPKMRFNRLSEEIGHDGLNSFFDEPNADSNLLTSDLDLHSNLSFSDREPDSSQSSSDMVSDSGRSAGGFDSNTVKSTPVKSNTKSKSDRLDRNNEQKKPSKGKAKVAILLTFVVAIVCVFMLISTTRHDSLSIDDENTSSYANTKQDNTKAMEQTENTTKDASTTATTSESTTESSEVETTTTSAAIHYDTISPGQRGDDVMNMQKRLAQLGYIKEDSCTGYYGTYTEKKVKMFQRKAGLQPTGIADSETLARLYAPDAPDCLDD